MKKTCWLARLARGWRLDRNPLRLGRGLAGHRAALETAAL